MSDMRRKLEEEEAYKRLNPQFIQGIQNRLDAGDVMFKRTDVVALMVLHYNTEKMMNAMGPPMAALFTICMNAGLVEMIPNKPSGPGSPPHFGAPVPN